jgi:transcriptional regulator GlxA family with amidase domain
MSKTQVRDEDAADKAARILDLEFDSPRSLTALSLEVGVSPTQLSRAFHSRHGVTIPGYVRRLRTTLASHLLSTTDMMIGEVGLAVGYHSMSAFVRGFTRESGRTPSTFRAEARTQAAAEKWTALAGNALPATS